MMNPATTVEVHVCVQFTHKTAISFRPESVNRFIAVCQRSISHFFHHLSISGLPISKSDLLGPPVLTPQKRQQHLPEFPVILEHHHLMPYGRRR